MKIFQEDGLLEQDDVHHFHARKKRFKVTKDFLKQMTDERSKQVFYYYIQDYLSDKIKDHLLFLAVT